MSDIVQIDVNGKKHYANLMLVGTMLRTTDSLSISEIVLSPSSLG